MNLWSTLRPKSFSSLRSLAILFQHFILSNKIRCLPADARLATTAMKLYQRAIRLQNLQNLQNLVVCQRPRKCSGSLNGPRNDMGQIFWISCSYRSRAYSSLWLQIQYLQRSTCAVRKRGKTGLLGSYSCNNGFLTDILAHMDCRKSSFIAFPFCMEQTRGKNQF